MSAYGKDQIGVDPHPLPGHQTTPGGPGAAAPAPPGDGGGEGAESIVARPVMYPHLHNRGMGLLHEGYLAPAPLYLRAAMRDKRGIAWALEWLAVAPPPPTAAFTTDATGRLVLVTPKAAPR